MLDWRRSVLGLRQWNRADKLRSKEVWRACSSVHSRDAYTGRAITLGESELCQFYCRITKGSAAPGGPFFQSPRVRGGLKKLTRSMAALGRHVFPLARNIRACRAQPRD